MLEMKGDFDRKLQLKDTPILNNSVIPKDTPILTKSVILKDTPNLNKSAILTKSAILKDTPSLNKSAISKDTSSLNKSAILKETPILNNSDELVSPREPKIKVNKAEPKLEKMDQSFEKPKKSARLYPENTNKSPHKNTSQAENEDMFSNISLNVSNMSLNVSTTDTSSPKSNRSHLKRQKKSLEDYEIVNPDKDMFRGLYGTVIKLVKEKGNPSKLFAMKIVHFYDIF